MLGDLRGWLRGRWGLAQEFESRARGSYYDDRDNGDGNQLIAAFFFLFAGNSVKSSKAGPGHGLRFRLRPGVWLGFYFWFRALLFLFGEWHGRSNFSRRNRPDRFHLGRRNTAGARR